MTPMNLYGIISPTRLSSIQQLQEDIMRQSAEKAAEVHHAVEHEHLLEDPTVTDAADRFERAERIRRAMFQLAAGAALQPWNESLNELCRQIWRAPLSWKRWQPAGWQPKEGGEGPSTAAILSMLVLCEPFIRGLTEDDRRWMRQRAAEHCRRIEEDVYEGRSWFFGGAEGEDIPLGREFTAVVSAFLIAALALEDSEPQAAAWRRLATDLLIRSMKETGEDGSYFGGIGEALPTLAEVYTASVMLLRHGDDRLAGTPLLQNAPWWLLDTTLPDRSGWLPLNFNANLPVRHNPLAQRILLLALVQQPNPCLNWYLHRVLGGPGADIFVLAFYQPGLPQQEPTANEAILLMLPHIQWLRSSPNRLLLPNLRSEAANTDRKVAHYPMQGVIVYRSGFGVDDSLLAFKGGWLARGPDHFDRNSVLFFDGGSPVLVESGSCGEETPEEALEQRQLRAHNTLEVDDGKAEKNSGHEWVWTEEDGSISIKGDAGASYPQILRFLRMVQVEEKEGKIERVIIRDEILPADNREHRAVLRFYTPPSARLDGNKVIIPAGDREWHLSIQNVSSPAAKAPHFEWQAESPKSGKFDPIAFAARGMIPPVGVRIIFHLERWCSETK